MKISIYWKLFVCLLFVLAGLTGCEENDPSPSPVLTGKSGVFILFEGSRGENNSGVSYFNLESGETTADMLNNTLGDTGNDLLLYGSKLYAAVTNSSVITVIDPITQKVIKTISVKDEKGSGRQPRFLTFGKGKVYASTSDGYVIRVDTTSFALDAAVAVGPNPEGIAYVNEKIYVAVSDAFNPDGVGNTVAVVNVNTLQKEKTLIVGENPFYLQADAYGDIYLSYLGDYNDAEKGPGFQRIDTKTDQVYAIAEVVAKKFTIVDDVCYFYGEKYDAAWNATYSYGKYDVKTESIMSDRLITDGTVVHIPYGIGVNPDDKNIYISDTDYKTPGKVFVFNEQGEKIKTINAGINPGTFAFY